MRTKFVSLKYAKNNRRHQSRLAVVVSKKVTKKSPLRNRMRRRLYEVVRLQWSLIEPEYDLVITVFDERIATAPHEELAQIVKELLTKAGVYKS